MNLNIAHDDGDKLYVDSSNNITAKNNDIVTIIIPVSRQGKIFSLANTIGLHLGLKDGELYTFVYIYTLTIKSNNKYFGRSHIVDCLTKLHGCSTRTINRYIDILINRQALLYDAYNFTIKINPKYLANNITESIKLINIIFATTDV